MYKTNITRENGIIIAAYHMAHRKQLHTGEAVCIDILIKSGDIPREWSRREFMRYLERDLLPYKRQLHRSENKNGKKYI